MSSKALSRNSAQKIKAASLNIFVLYGQERYLNCKMVKRIRKKSKHATKIAKNKYTRIEMQPVFWVHSSCFLQLLGYFCVLKRCLFGNCKDFKNRVVHTVIFSRKCKLKKRPHKIIYH